MNSTVKNSTVKNSAVKKIISELSRYPQVKAIYLFGSQVRGEAGPLSDVDFCVIAPGSSEEEKSTMLSYSSKQVDIVVWEDLPLPAQGRVVKEGKPLYVADQSFIDELFWRTIKEYWDFKPLLQRFLKTYLPGAHYE